MVKSYYFRFKHSKNIFGIYLIFGLFVLFTLVYFLGINFTVNEYARIGTKFTPISMEEIQYFWGLKIAGRSTSTILSIIENLLPEFIFPLIIGVFFSNTFYEDYETKSKSILLVRQSRFSYYILNSIKSASLVFILFFIGMLSQFVLGRAIISVFNPAQFNLGLNQSVVLSLIVSSVRVSIYYACVLFFSLGIGSIFRKIKYLPYALPLIAMLTPVFIFPRNIPFRQAFVENGTIFPFSNSYYLMLVIFIVLGLISFGIRLFALKDEL